jgi:transketolase
MRDAFAQELTALAAADPRIVLLSGDIGNRMFNAFKARCPERFMNCGVAEANMASMAAGLALCGLRPVTYTIAAFNTARCLEQIRVDICYHRLPVVIVGTGAGFSYAENGGTHLACEDIAMLRALPNMAVVCPGDSHEVRLALRAALKLDGPVYLRIGKKGEPAVHAAPPQNFEIGKALVVRPGKKVCLLSTGNMLPNAVRAAELLEQNGISAEVVSLHTVKPLDRDFLRHAFNSFELVATLEEHGADGGFGGAVAEWLADNGGRGATLLRLAAPTAFPEVAGDQEYLRQMWQLTPEEIAARIHKKLKDSLDDSLSPCGRGPT